MKHLKIIALMAVLLIVIGVFYVLTNQSVLALKP